MKKSSFLEGAFIATLCIVISKVLGVLYVIPFYRMIGEGGGTLYGYAYNIYNVFLIVSSAGIPLAISKLTSEYHTLGEENKKTRMYRLATSIIFSFSVLSFLICFLFAPQLSQLIIGDLEGGNSLEDVTFVIRLISFALLIVPFLSIARGYLQGHRYIKEPSLSQVIEQLVRIFIILAGSFICSILLGLDTKFSVGVSVFAASLGALASYLYLNRSVRKNKALLGLDKKAQTSKSEDREILKKIVLYAIPFIIINLANTLYNSTDMILVIRTLPKLGFTAADTEFVSSVFTTWGVKFNTIITSVSTGLIVSLIPNMVKDYTEKNMEAVNSNFNKCLKIILLVIAPLAIFMSGMSQSVWNLFYGESDFGPKIISYSILVTILDCLYMVTNSLLQSLNKPKIIYSSVILGLLTNLLLDVPLMYAFSHFGLPAYYGAITATLVGFLVSCGLTMIYLRSKMGFVYKETFKAVPRFLISAFILVGMLQFFRYFLPCESQNKILQIGILALAGICCGGVYLLINFKSLGDILPEKITRKLTKFRLKK
jgi:O-antigen/teichoic acid export membrane protein